jgi:hypothetical protein
VGLEPDYECNLTVSANTRPYAVNASLSQPDELVLPKICQWLDILRKMKSLLFRQLTSHLRASLGTSLLKWEMLITRAAALNPEDA